MKDRVGSFIAFSLNGQTSFDRRKAERHRDEHVSRTLRQKRGDLRACKGHQTSACDRADHTRHQQGSRPFQSISELCDNQLLTPAQRDYESKDQAEQK